MSPAVTSGRCRLSIVFLALATASSTQAAGQPLPARAQWQASASSKQVAALAPAYAIDGDETTRWGGTFSPGHWLQVDLGRAADVGGVRIHWDSGFAVGYRIQASLDGQQWRDVYVSQDSRGATDYLFFPTTSARYLRLASPERTADWGVSVFEFEPLAASRAARLANAGAQAAAIWQGQSTSLALPTAQLGNARALDIDLPRADPVAGLEVWWDGPRNGARLQARDRDGHWRDIADDPGSAGDVSFLAARASFAPTALRLIAGLEGPAPRVRRLRLLGPEQVLTPTKRLEVLAARDHATLFPSILHREQVYWTVVGVPAGRQKSIFDEYGNVEAFKGAPMVQAIWRDGNGQATIADNVARTQSLREGWMPMPSVQWQPRDGLRIRNDAMAITQENGQPVTLLRYRIENTGTAAAEGELALLVRPLQVNPQWQHGGVSPIHAIALDGTPAATDVRINGRVLLSSLSTVDQRGAVGFGAHGETEPTAAIAAGLWPDAKQASDDDGLASAVLGYHVALAPGAHQDVVIALPLGTQPRDAKTGELPPASPILRDGWQDAGVAFDRAADALAEQWQKRFGAIGISLPDHSLVDMLRAQGAYMLLNQTGPAMQPGPRNYNRSFIRDGAATGSALLRMGQPQVARDYLRWYTDHAVHADGLVSPILNEDGSVNRGFGSDIEYDSQGEYIALVADVARLDGGAETVRDYLPKVIAAMRFMQQLRERTMVPGYMADQPAPERFHGIIAPSISHEGYSSPTHSYWDDYWALKGWHDGIWLAEQLGDEKTAQWAREQYEALRGSVAASIRATMKWKGSDFIPSSADLGDGDPTGVSIALDPTGQQDILPPRELANTFDRYLADVRAREQPGALFAYTPYEMRNVLTYVHLDRTDDAEELLDLLMAHRRPLPWQVLAEVVHSRLRYPGYLGDMPHTWIGAEYARTLFGMLFREEDDALVLLPGTPRDWLRDDGVRLDALPTVHGKLTLSARLQDDRLQLKLGPGLRKDTALRIAWPGGMRPAEVRVDGKLVREYDDKGISLARPFHSLEARWDNGTTKRSAAR